MRRFLSQMVKNYRPVSMRDKDESKRGYYQDIMRGVDSEVLYMRRYFLGSFLGMTFFLHRFYSGDGDDWFHDHPWDRSYAVVLAGSYLEERIRHFDPRSGMVATVRRVRFFNRLRFDDFHRIAKIVPQTWTLFVHFGRTKEWGFFERVKANNEVGFVLQYHQPFLATYLERLEKDGDSQR